MEIEEKWVFTIRTLCPRIFTECAALNDPHPPNGRLSKLSKLSIGWRDRTQSLCLHVENNQIFEESSNKLSLDSWTNRISNSRSRNHLYNSLPSIRCAVLNEAMFIVLGSLSFFFTSLKDILKGEAFKITRKRNVTNQNLNLNLVHKIGNSKRTRK